MRVAKTLPSFWFLRGNRNKITLAWNDFPFLVVGPESMRGRELERVFFERIWRRNDLELYLSFGVWTRGLKRASSSFLKRKERKVRWEFFWFNWTCGNREGELLESSFFEKVKQKIKVQPIRTKKEENKEAKQEGSKKFLVQPRSQAKISWVIHVYC